MVFLLFSSCQFILLSLHLHPYFVSCWPMHFVKMLIFSARQHIYRARPSICLFSGIAWTGGVERWGVKIERSNWGSVCENFFLIFDIKMVSFVHSAWNFFTVYLNLFYTHNGSLVLVCQHWEVTVAFAHAETRNNRIKLLVKYTLICCMARSNAEGLDGLACLRDDFPF